MGKKTVRGHDIANRFVYSLRARIPALKLSHLYLVLIQTCISPAFLLFHRK